MIISSNKRNSSSFSSYGRRNSGDESTRFRSCSSLTIQGTHRAQTSRYPKCSVKILSTVFLETSGTVSKISLTVRSSRTSASTRPTDQVENCIDVPWPVLRERFFGPPKIPCTTSWRFRCPWRLGRMQKSVADEFQWMKSHWSAKIEWLNVLCESGDHPLRCGWLLCQDWASQRSPRDGELSEKGTKNTTVLPDFA